MTPLQSQLRCGRLYAQLNEYQYYIRKAHSDIEKMREIAPHSYLSLSFGKQSIVLAHILFHVEPDLPMYFLASGESWQMHNFREIIDDFTSRWDINLTVVQTDHVYDGQELDWKSSRDAGQNDLQSLSKIEDWDGWYWGLTKEESKQRQLTLSRTKNQLHWKHNIYQYQDGKYRCCPLAEWENMQLAAYIATHDIPLLEIYHEFGLDARTTARMTKQTARWGGLTHLKQHDITAYNEMLSRFPSLRGFDVHS